MAGSEKPVLLICVNTYEFFMSHRLPIALTAHSSGFDVHVMTSVVPKNARLDSSFTFHQVPLVRSGQNPFTEFYTLLFFILKFSRIKPDLVHLVSIKPVIYGGIAARSVGVKSVVAAISGLGSVFSANRGLPLLRLRLVRLLYRVALKHKNLRVIFQNADDKEKLLSTRAIVPSQTVIIRGSGVSLGEYPYLPEPEGLPVVAMAARLLKEKGICEFVEAARILKARNIKADMRLIGSPDFGNPSSVTEEELARWKAEGVVNLLGFRTDIAAQYAKSNIVCLPSYYGEGLPKSLIEAAACGRAVVTTDMPGCRDAITPDETGILIEPRNAVALADAIQYLIENPTVRMKIGEAGRKLAENAFTIESVVEQHMSIYQELLANASEK